MSKKAEYALAKTVLKNFIGTHQLHLIDNLSKGEDGQFFVNRLIDLHKVVKNAPVTYDQDGLGDKAKVVLHYFNSSNDWYITEIDVGDDENVPAAHQPQLQAFGFVFNEFGIEYGYISIEHLKEENSVEIDLHFEETTVGEIKKKAGL